MTECQRSRIDSEDREPPEPTCSSTRPTTDLQQSQSFNPFSQESKHMIHEDGIIGITRHGTQIAVQSMFITLGHRHRLLHVRALLAKKNRGE